MKKTLITYPTIRKVNIEPPSLRDIEEHTNEVFRDSSKITVAHETTHQINSEIRNKYEGMAGFYFLKNNAVLLEKPPGKITELRSLIPEVFRKGPYNLYLVQQVHDWDSEPLYLMDEWVAYSNGAQVGLEMAASGSNEEGWSEFQNSLYFSAYCYAMQKYLNSKGITHINEIVDLFTKRSIDLYKQAKKYPRLSNEQNDVIYGELMKFHPGVEHHEVKDFGASEYL